MFANLRAWACCHRWKLAGTLLTAVLSTTSFFRGLSLVLANTEAADPFVGSAEVLAQRPAFGQIKKVKLSGHVQVNEGASRVEPAEQVLRVRGKLAYTRDVVTEGPRVHPGHYDSSEVYFEVPQSFDTLVYVLGWKPVVDKHRCSNGSEVELVHHMNILAKEEADIRAMFPSGESVRLGGDHGGLKIVATYDRGASAYRLPKGYGINFSPQLPRLVLEYHLLVPDCWDFTQEPVLETSGFDLYITHERPRHLAALAGFFDESLRIDKDQGMVEQTTQAQSPTLANYFLAPMAGDAAGSDLVEIVAIHLHTHDIAQTKTFEVIDKHGRCRFRSPTEQGGYGDTQTMKNLVGKGWPRLRLAKGESLRVKCAYDTHTFKKTLVDGTSLGEEMCSVLMVVSSGAVDTGGSFGTVLSMNDGFAKRVGRELLRLISPPW